MSVFYKFKSAKNYDTVDIDSASISIPSLKSSILQQKKMKNTDFDLVIENAQTGQVYQDNELVPKNTSVIVKRVPVTNKVMHHQSNMQSTSYSKPRSFTLVNNHNTADMSNLNDEDAKLNAMINGGMSDWIPETSKSLANQPISHNMKNMMANKQPPAHYTCHRCGKPGHFIQFCPTNGDPRYNIVRGTNGIPTSMLKRVEGPGGSERGVLKMKGGGYVVMQPSESDFEKAISGGLYSSKTISNKGDSNLEVPQVLLCKICEKLMENAVTLPCCKSSFCNSCIVHKLVDETDNKCPICDASVMLNDLQSNEDIRTGIEEWKKNGTLTVPSLIQDQTEKPLEQPNFPVFSTTMSSNVSTPPLITTGGVPTKNVPKPKMPANRGTELTVLSGQPVQTISSYDDYQKQSTNSAYDKDSNKRRRDEESRSEDPEAKRRRTDRSSPKEEARKDRRDDRRDSREKRDDRKDSRDRRDDRHDSRDRRDDRDRRDRDERDRRDRDDRGERRDDRDKRDRRDRDDRDDRDRRSDRSRDDRKDRHESRDRRDYRNDSRDKRDEKRDDKRDRRDDRDRRVRDDYSRDRKDDRKDSRDRRDDRHDSRDKRDDRDRRDRDDRRDGRDHRSSRDEKSDSRDRKSDDKKDDRKDRNDSRDKKDDRRDSRDRKSEEKKDDVPVSSETSNKQTQPVQQQEQSQTAIAQSAASPKPSQQQDTAKEIATPQQQTRKKKGPTDIIISRSTTPGDKGRTVHVVQDQNGNNREERASWRNNSQQQQQPMNRKVFIVQNEDNSHNNNNNSSGGRRNGRSRRH